MKFDFGEDVVEVLKTNDRCLDSSFKLSAEPKAKIAKNRSNCTAIHICV